MTTMVMSNQLPALSSGSLNAYLDSIQQISLLTAEEEADLFLRFQEYNDVQAAREIVLSHLRYVAYVARSYMGYGLPLEDIIQQGNVGLMKSVKKFNLSYKVRLVSFAVHWIKAEIHEFILKNWKIVKIATTKAQRKLFFNLRKAKNRLGWLKGEEVVRVAEDLGVKPEEVVEMENRLSRVDETYDQPDVGDDDLTASPAIYLSKGHSEDPAWVTESEEISDQTSKGLTKALAALDERSRDIVQSRWLANEKAGLKDLAEVYGVSMERIRQIEAKAFEKMQSYLEAS